VHTYLLALKQVGLQDNGYCLTNIRALMCEQWPRMPTSADRHQRSYLIIETRQYAVNSSQHPSMYFKINLIIRLQMCSRQQIIKFTAMLREDSVWGKLHGFKFKIACPPSFSRSIFTKALLFCFVVLLLNDAVSTETTQRR
jgi:hypothetical protein